MNNDTEADIKTIIFDFDGTLVNTYDYILKIAKNLAPEIGIDKNTITKERIEEFRRMTYKELFAYFEIKPTQIPSLVKAWQREFENISKDIKLINGMDNIINKIKSKGIIIGILTSNNIRSVNDVLKNIDYEIFDFVKESKGLGGKSKELNKILKNYGIAKNNAIYIGDEIRDITAAKEAGILSGGVTWGLNTKNDLLKQNPNYLFEKPKDILKII